MKFLILLAVAVALSGCAAAVVDRSWPRCDLLRIAFDEQDELSPGWYDAALTELKACGMQHYSADAAKTRGRS